MKKESFNFKEYNRNWLGQSMIGVYEGAIRISSKAQKDLRINVGEYIEIFLDEEKDTIGIKISDRGAIRGTIVKKHGYCKVKIGSIMKLGRYIYQNTSEGLFIFKK